MAQFVKVATLDEIKPGCAIRFTVNTKDIAIFNLNGTFYAIDDACTHMGGPLSQGYIENSTVICPWHGSEFDIKTGKVLTAPALENVSSYTVRINGSDIEVEI